MSLNIIGISAFYHDSACCLMQDGKLVAAAQEERFTRLKQDPSLPQNAFLYCLREGGVAISDIDCLAFYETPEKKLARQLWSGLTPELLSKNHPKRFEREVREVLGYEGPIAYFDHHLSHAASSFFFSGFHSSAIMTVDGVGEWATTTYGIGKDISIDILEEVLFPDSIGLLYSTITSYLGFSVNGGEYKVMGLAPYGSSKYKSELYKLIEKGSKGQYSLNMHYFDFVRGEGMFSENLCTLLGQAARKPESELKQFHMDVSRSLQVVLEEILLDKSRYLHEITQEDNLCLAGGVALNCVANGHILRQSPFKRLFVQPAANDAGGAIGAAALAHVANSNVAPERKRMPHAYLGPSYSSEEISSLLDSSPITSEDYRTCPDDLIKRVATELKNGKVIGWFQGRMEFGPRALGSRSIIADPMDPDMRDRINAMVKKREGFRPFAPVILEEYMTDHFELDHPSPFMLETCQVRSSLKLPAITHVDNSARVQTINDDTNKKFSDLLREFYSRTGCPILLNTSFNVRDEPIVCSPEDALACFILTDIDCLVLGDFFIEKTDNSVKIIDGFVKSLKSAKLFRGTGIRNDIYTFL